MADTAFEPTPAEQLPPKDVERVVEAFQSHREKPELSGANAHEVLRQAVKTVSPVQPVAKKNDGDDDDAKLLHDPLPAYAEKASPQTKQEIEHLLTMAFSKGLDAATDAARHSNAYVIDAFHDALAGKLMPVLKRRGLVS